MKKPKVTQHKLIPTHKKLSENDKKKFLEDNNFNLENLPSIKLDDPALQEMNVKPGDIIEIERESPTAGRIVFHRGVIE